MPKKISAVVLAAGETECLGRTKLLLPVGDRPIIRMVGEHVARSKADPVMVVAGKAEAATRTKA